MGYEESMCLTKPCLCPFEVKLPAASWGAVTKPSGTPPDATPAFGKASAVNALGFLPEASWGVSARRRVNLSTPPV